MGIFVSDSTVNIWVNLWQNQKLYLVVRLPSYSVFPMPGRPSPMPRPSALGILIWGVTVYFAYTLNTLNTLIIVSASGIHFVIRCRKVRQVLSFLEMKTLSRVKLHDICKWLNQVYTISWYLDGTQFITLKLDSFTIFMSFGFWSCFLTLARFYITLTFTEGWNVARKESHHHFVCLD